MRPVKSMHSNESNRLSPDASVRTLAPRNLTLSAGGGENIVFNFFFLLDLLNETNTRKKEIRHRLRSVVSNVESICQKQEKKNELDEIESNAQATKHPTPNVSSNERIGDEEESRERCRLIFGILLGR